MDFARVAIFCLLLHPVSLFAQNVFPSVQSNRYFVDFCLCVRFFAISSLIPRIIPAHVSLFSSCGLLGHVLRRCILRFPILWHVK